MNKHKRLDDIEGALEPAEPAPIIVLDMTDEPDEAEAERRWAAARSEAGANGHVLEVLFENQRSYSRKPARRVSMRWDYDEPE